MILEEKLIELIKELKRNGYIVSRDGGATENGMASGIMTIRNKDRQGFNVVTEVPLGDSRDTEGYLRERFNV